ncbi:MAG: response regulator [Deltaproteobacteria bacterium]|nr:response regulator [Deltaproteobacteria bacterium]
MTAVLLGNDGTLSVFAEEMGVSLCAVDEVRGLPVGTTLLVPFTHWKRRETELAGLVRAHRDFKFTLLSGDPAAPRAAERVGATFLPLPVSREALLKHCDACDRTRRILLAEDSATARKTLVRALTEAGHVVVEAEDGRAAIEALGDQPFDMVVTDVEMPHANGYDVCRAVRSNPNTAALPVIIQSSLAEGKDIVKGFEVGANDYIVKPVNLDEFVTKIANIFAGLTMRGRERILAVDDSQIVRGLISQGLSQQGFTVELGEDGKDGFARATACPPDLIISDFDMPEMTGFEMVAALRKDERTKDVPVIMLTARDTQMDRAMTTAAGARAYVTKPFNVNDIVAVVERIFAEVRLTREQEAMQRYLSEGARRAAKRHAKAGTVELLGEEKTISILFSDIKGFTSKSAAMQPGEVVKMLNAYFDVMTSELAKEEAIIDKFIGDAIMALFEGDDCAIRACRAALAMQASHAIVNRTREDPIVTRIGINTGKVIVGEIGSATVRREYTAIGDSVNRAQRFESNAPPGGVLISTSTFERIEAMADVEPTELRLKGIDEPVRAYKLLGLKGDKGTSA